MANNSTYKYGESYTKKASCFIDASSLGDEFEAVVESAPQQDSKNEVQINTMKNNNQQRSTDSLENSSNLWNESLSQSWFVSMSNDTSIENSPREDTKNNAHANSENVRKKGIFDMFVELNDPKEELPRNLPKTTPNQKHAFKRLPKHNLVEAKYTLGSSSSSDRESGFTENTDSSPSESIAPLQPKYPSLVKLSDLDSDPATMLSPILECTDESKITNLTAEQKALKPSYRPLYLENVKTLMNLFPNLWNARDIAELSHSEHNAMNSDSMNRDICNASALGDDLLRLLENDIATDLTVDIAGRRLRVHKCVVIPRCRYFAGLSRRLVESTGNIIHIDGFTYNTVYFALRYIYAGQPNLPDSMDLVELTSLADMFGLEGLKEVIAATIIEKYCHNFHKPCGLCTLSVLDCLPLAMQYDLDEIYQRSLTWLTENFIEIWSTKAFATMPVEALERIFHKQEVNMTPESVVNLVYGCRQIGLSLPNKRWAETVKKISESLLRSAENFSASHLSDVLYSLLNAPSASIHLTESVIVEWIEKTIEKAPVKELCKAYRLLSDYCVGIHPSMYSHGELRVVEEWRRLSEDTLVSMPTHVTLSPGFKALPQELRSRLNERGCIVKGVFGSTPVQVNRMTRTMPVFVPTLSQRIDLTRMYKTFVPYIFRPVLSSEAIHTDALRKTHHETVTIQKSVSQQKSEITLVVRTTRAQLIRQQFNKESSKSKAVNPRRQVSVISAPLEKPKQKQRDAKAKSSSTTSLLSTSGANDPCNTKAAPSHRPVASTTISTKDFEQNQEDTKLRSASATSLLGTSQIHESLNAIPPHRPVALMTAVVEKPKQKKHYTTVKSSSAVALFSTSAANDSSKSKFAISRRPVAAVSAPVEKPKQKQQDAKIKSSSTTSLLNTNGPSKFKCMPPSSRTLEVDIIATRSFSNPVQLHPDVKNKSTSVLSVTGNSNIFESTKCKATSKSKIPVYVGGRKKGRPSMTSQSEPSLARVAKVANAAASGKKLPGKRDRSAGSRLASLMLPTASSAAKMVPKKTTTNGQLSGASQTPSGETSLSPLPRSSTFVKEAPCFPGSPDISQS